MEELFGLLIFVVFGIVQLVKFLGKMDVNKSNASFSGNTQQRNNPQHGVSKIKKMLEDTFSELTDTRSNASSSHKKTQSSFQVTPQELPKPLYREETVKKKKNNTGQNPISQTILSKPSKLREAIILKEILDRPVSERL